MTDAENWEIRRVPVSKMTRDISVNPRNPNDTWAKKQIATYDPDIIGMFVLSERKTEQGTELVILDGSNRARLMELVGDTERPVVCQVFTGLTHQEEARTAREYNDRQAWKSVRIFMADCASGDPVAQEILKILEGQGWSLNVQNRGAKGGTIQGVLPFYRFLRVAEERAVREAGAPKGTERYAAAVLNGRADGMRILDMAVQVYTNAFPARPSSYTPPIMYGIALMILVHEGNISLERLTTQIRDFSMGQRTLLTDAKSMTGPMRCKLPDSVAQLCIRLYNKNLPSTARTRLDTTWTPIAR